MSDFNEHKTRLEAELAQVTKELEAIARQDHATGDWVAIPDVAELGSADPNVEADAVEEWNERRSLMPTLETRYRNIVRALEKIEAGTYGPCESSGEPIEAERLAVNPAARTNLANLDREKELPL